MANARQAPRRLRHKDIENAFQPAKEISSTNRFAGRNKAVSSAYYSLISEGTSIAIVGNRGVGKTSLARQLMNIAQGDNSLLEKFDLPADDQLDFLAFYFACGRNTRNYQDLLKRLLTDSNCLARWNYYVESSHRSSAAARYEGRAHVLSIGGSAGREKWNESTSKLAVSDHSIDTVFQNVLHKIVEEENKEDGILIVVDEFDQIEDPTGFASLLKSLSTNVPHVKFCLVGVAQDVADLIHEHESVNRLFAGGIIHLPPMSDRELLEIVRIGEESIGNQITFAPNAKRKLTSLAQGHPYMVHLIGKHALRLTYQADQKKVREQDIVGTLKWIADNGIEPTLEARYKKAVGTSRQREIVLKAMAKTQQGKDGEIPTKQAYSIASAEGVDNSSYLVGKLVTKEYGAELQMVRRGYYRFKDSLFAAYVEARPPLVLPVVSRRSQVDHTKRIGQAKNDNGRGTRRRAA